MSKSLIDSKLCGTAILLALSAVFLITACTAQKPYSVRMVESEMKRCPTAADLDGMAGKLKWNYTTGLELLSFLDAAYPSARSKGPVRVPQGLASWSMSMPGTMR